MENRERMNHKVTDLTKEQNVYFSEKLKLDLRILELLILCRDVLPVIVVLVKRRELITRLSAVSIWGFSHCSCSLPYICFLYLRSFSASGLDGQSKSKKTYIRMADFIQEGFRIVISEEGETGGLCREGSGNGENRYFTT